MSFIRESYKRLTRAITARHENKLDRLIVLQALLNAKINRGVQLIEDISEVEFKAFSQWGEDGIIDWLVERLSAHGIPETFVEFGVEDYRESNTRLLIELRNWRGLVMDSSQENIDAIKKQEIWWKQDLEAITAHITAENINSLISRADLDGDIGLLSIDIDGNDYWVWKALTVVNPWIVICEYNAVFGDRHAISIPYKPDFNRTIAHYSNLYWGASIKAFEELAISKGYVLVGTNIAGCNAFFVREDKWSIIRDSVKTVRVHGSRFRDSRDQLGNLTSLRGLKRLQEISHLPVENIDTIEIKPLEQFDGLWSNDWQRLYS